jgi:hypothetical protein
MIEVRGPVVWCNIKLRHIAVVPPHQLTRELLIILFTLFFRLRPRGRYRSQERDGAERRPRRPRRLPAHSVLPPGQAVPA